MTGFDKFELIDGSVGSLTLPFLRVTLDTMTQYCHQNEEKWVNASRNFYKILS